jgi:hypothetical protein
MDGTIGCIVVDASLETHEVEVEALGPPKKGGEPQFSVRVTRSSPAPVGKVTSTATYGAFLESLLKAHSRGQGVHFV